MREPCFCVLFSYKSPQALSIRAFDAFEKDHSGNQHRKIGSRETSFGAAVEIWLGNEEGSN